MSVIRSHVPRPPEQPSPHRCCATPPLPPTHSADDPPTRRGVSMNNGALVPESKLTCGRPAEKQLPTNTVRRRPTKFGHLIQDVARDRLPRSPGPADGRQPPSSAAGGRSSSSS